MILIRQAPRHIQPPVQWVPGLFPGDKVTGAWRWPPTPFFLDDIYGYGLPSVPSWYPRDLPSANNCYKHSPKFVYAEENSLRPSCFSRALLLYEYLFCCEQLIPNCFAKAIKLNFLTKVTKDGRECIILWSWRKFIFACITVLVSIICSVRRHSFYKIYCSGK